MVKFEEVKQQIEKSRLTVEQKDLILKFLPNFGGKVLDFVYKESQKYRFELIGDVLVEILKMFQLPQNNIENKNFSAAIEILNQAPLNGRWEDGAYILPWALDLKDQVSTKKVFPASEMLTALFDFELKMFNILPKEELTELFNQQLLFSISNSNLLMELKSYIFSKNLLDDNKFLQNLQRAMQANEELIGKNLLASDNKNIPPMIKNWLKDFISWLPKGAGGINTFQEVQYTKTSKNFNALNTEQKDQLLDAIKIYSWLLNPVASTKEVDDFEDFKKQERNKALYMVSEKFELPEELFKTSNNLPPVPPRAPNVKPSVPVEDVRTEMPQEEAPPRLADPIDGYRGSDSSMNIQNMLKNNSLQQDQNRASSGLSLGSLGKPVKPIIPPKEPQNMTASPLQMEKVKPSQENKNTVLNIDKKLEELKKRTGSK